MYVGVCMKVLFPIMVFAIGVGSMRHDRLKEMKIHSANSEGE